MKHFLFLITVFLFTACSQNDIIEMPPTIENEEFGNTKSNDFVSTFEAADVANAFFSNLINLDIQSSTRSEDNKVENVKNIKTIETLYNEDGNTPAIYIINYTGGGFAIISATKNYYPILAYSEKNSISIEGIQNINEGLTIWAEETKQAIEKSKTLPEDTLSMMRNMWANYKTKETSETKGTTRSFTYEQYTKFRQRMSELYNLCPGYSFGPLTTAQYYLPPHEYESLVNKAALYGSPIDCTLFGYKRTYYEVGPLINTEWNQGESFNNLCPNQYPAGCVNIAIAQIMKYHEVPRKYNWSNMPKNYGTIDTQTLIYDIGQATHTKYDSDGSSSNIDNAKHAFSIMGYNVTKKDHNYEDVRVSIGKRRPVYMRGDRENFLGITWKGHAWVCEGVQDYTSAMTYFVEFLLNTGNYSNINGPSWQSPGTTTYGLYRRYCYMNWGWGRDTGNGWYLSDSVESQGGNYKYDRKNLYAYPI